MTKQLPPIHPDLVACLEELFPNRCPSINDSERKIWIEVGMQEMIAFLKYHLKIQQDDAKGGFDDGDGPTIRLSSIFTKPINQ